MSSMPGSSSAAGAPAGETSRSRRLAPLRRARSAGPMSRHLRAVEAHGENRATRFRHCPRPRARATSAAADRVCATHGADSISSVLVTGVGTRIPVAPAARAASTSAPMSPMTTHLVGSTPKAPSRRADESGPWLPTLAAVVGTVVAHLPRVERPDRPVDPLVDGADVVRADEAACTPDWFVMTPTRIPLMRRRSTECRASGIGRTCSGVAVVGHVLEIVPSRSKSTASTGRRPRLGVAVPPPTGEAVGHGGGGIHGARPRHRGDLAPRPRSGCDPAQHEVPGESRPAAAPGATQVLRSPRPASPAAAASVVATCQGSRPRPVPARRRQSLPWRRRISASSMLPRCTRTLTDGSAGRTGCRVPLSHHELPAHASRTRRARSASSR